MKKKTKYECVVPSWWEVQFIGEVRYEWIIRILMKINETVEIEIDN